MNRRAFLAGLAVALGGARSGWAQAGRLATFGAKDIMETRGLSTDYGSPVYKGRLGSTDASIVTSLRQRGAVLLGKTHTTAFAYRTPYERALTRIADPRERVTALYRTTPAILVPAATALRRAVSRRPATRA